MVRIVVDESISPRDWQRFEAFARKKGLPTEESLWVRHSHSGMPDSEILHHLLDESTVLVTTDRPFHNEVLGRGLRSFYVGGHDVTGKRLRGIHDKRQDAYKPGGGAVRDWYHPPSTEIRRFLLPDSASRLKRLTTKRRRIRNHFGGQDHLDQVAVTVSWRTLGQETLIGVRLRVSSKVGIKAIDASESYVAEAVAPQHRGLAALCHGLVTVIQLMLHTVKTVVYYDAVRIDVPGPPEAPGDPYRELFGILAGSFPDLDFVAAPKGPSSRGCGPSWTSWRRRGMPTRSSPAVLRT